MTENPPRLSVVMVVRNAAATVAAALDSLAAQHYPNLELIVWDGLSDDGTLEVLAHYAHLITTLKSERDSGPADGCNKAVMLATGDYVGFLYGDDTYEPGVLWAVADSITAHPESDIISFGMVCRSNGRVSGYYAGERQLQLTLESALSDLPTFVLSRFYRRGVFGPLDSSYLANDRELMARLALQNLRNTVIPKALYGFSAQGGLSTTPAHYTRIIREHGMIAQRLLARSDLSEPQRRTVLSWQKRQLAAGLWKTLARMQWGDAKYFLREGLAINGWRFVALSMYLLGAKLLKRTVLALSGGINRGD